ncbi:unnamed protein product [Ambrosiozyma monospora]|uniref:Unnamed protein product n=1 Tax=Ambrosiozyma monospora TaxID=43982 RepID=A0ACB5T0M8_AMBMO|nr:unnamed protein product [Ambrosiozyma monospora]
MHQNPNQPPKQLKTVLHQDPEVQKFSALREGLIKYYRFNLKSASIAFLFLGAIPITLGYIGYKYQTINCIAKRRTEPVYLNNYVPRS